MITGDLQLVKAGASNAVGQNTYSVALALKRAL
jgi:hypothetical protein